VNIRTLHSHPTRGCVSQIVKAEIEDSLLLAKAAKGNAHLVRRDKRKHLVSWLGFAADWERLKD